MHYTSSSLRGFGLAGAVSGRKPTTPIANVRFVQFLVSGAVRARSQMCRDGWRVAQGHMGDDFGRNIYLPIFLCKLQQVAGLEPSATMDAATAKLLYALDDLANQGGIAQWVAERFAFKSPTRGECGLPGVADQRINAKHRPSSSDRQRAADVTRLVRGNVAAWLQQVGPDSDYGKLRVIGVPKVGHRGPVGRSADGRQGDANCITVADLFNAVIFNMDSAYGSAWYTEPDAPGGLKPWSVDLAALIAQHRSIYGLPSEVRMTPDTIRWLRGHKLANTPITGAWVNRTFRMADRLTRPMLALDRDGYIGFWQRRDPAVARLLVNGWNWNTWPQSPLHGQNENTLMGLARRDEQRRLDTIAAAERELARKAREAQEKAAQARRDERARRELQQILIAKLRAEEEVRRLRGQRLIENMQASMENAGLLSLDISGGLVGAGTGGSGGATGVSLIGSITHGAQAGSPFAPGGGGGSGFGVHLDGAFANAGAGAGGGSAAPPQEVPPGPQDYNTPAALCPGPACPDNVTPDVPGAPADVDGALVPSPPAPVLDGGPPEIAPAEEALPAKKGGIGLVVAAAVAAWALLS